MSRTTPSAQKSNLGGFHSAGRNLLLEKEAVLPGVAHARARVKASIKEYLQRLRRPDDSEEGQLLGGRALVRIKMSWANVNKERDVNLPHVHDGSELSGALYVSCPGQEQGSGQTGCSIVLADPRPAAQAGSALSVALNETSRKEIRAHAGDVLIFPSWLKHHVRPHLAWTEAERRISVSFNVDVELEPGPPPLKIIFKNLPAATEDVLVDPLVTQLKQLWATTVSLIPGEQKQVCKESLQAFANSLGDFGPQVPDVLSMSERSLPGVAHARVLIQQAVEAHVLREATSSLGGEAFVAISHSWAEVNRLTDLRGPMSRWDTSLSGILCVSCSLDCTVNLALCKLTCSR
ncbi:unnamed protein product [Polarella glacialis]|uniref:Uncharacterized protein n=1 Tax=Polarella glacialis TaxID=89957 RepID=A0A813LVF4_POLGL|nr:unnamed protein product [Polarella glacialis]